MRIASGDTSREIAFVAVDATDYATRETGLTGFTVYRSRDGGAATAMTTPTVTELDATNMPGVYTLLVDEDTTIGAGNDEEQMVFHVTASGMAPVTLTVQLFRPKYTEGSTLTLADINAECDTALADYDAPTKAELDSGFAALNDLSAAEVNAQVDAALLDYDGPTKAEMDGAFAALNDLSAAEVNAEVDTALADYDGPTKAEMDSAFTEIKGATFSGATDSLEAIRDRGDVAWITGGAGSAPTAGEIADAVWDEAIADHLTAGSTGASLNAAGGSGDPWVTALPGSYTAGQAGKILADILTDTGTTIPASISGLNDLSAGDVRTAIGLSSANLDTQLSAIDTVVDAILEDTGATIPGLVASLNDLSAADIRTAVGLSSADLDTQLAALPTAVENADTLLNRDMSAVSDTNARTPLNALRFLRNKWSVTGTTLTVTQEDDTTAAWTATLTADASADPVTGSDPA